MSKPIDGNYNVANKTNRISVAFLEELIENHRRNKAPTYRKYQKIYENKHIILERVKANDEFNNKIAADFGGYIINTTVGYFLGKPIVINYTEPTPEITPVEDSPVDAGVNVSEIVADTSVQDELDRIFTENSKDDLFMEWGKEAMIKGLSHLLVYQSEDSKTRFLKLHPEDVILVFNNSATKELQYAIRLYDIDTEDNDTTTHYAEVYDKTGYDVFTCIEGGSVKQASYSGYTFKEHHTHIYNKIPIITLYNNEEQMGDLERVETLINEYDRMISDTANEFEAFRNAYLVLKNMIADENQRKQLKYEAIIEVMDDGDAKFLTKQIQTDAINSHLDRLENAIHKFANVPDLSDEAFAGNLSGVAIKFKLFGIETNCIVKERKMTKAIEDLLRVLEVPIKVRTGKVLDVLNTKIIFTRDIPANVTEIVDENIKLQGKVSEETLLSRLPFIEDPKAEMEKVKAEAEDAKSRSDIYSPGNVIADSQILFPNLNTIPEDNSIAEDTTE